MKKSILISFLVLYAMNATGQKTFSVDSITNSVKETLPFDQKFYLKVFDPNQTIDGIFIYDAKFKKGELSPNTTPFNPNQNKISSKKGNYTYIEIQNLKPNRYYEFNLSHQFKEEQLDDLLAHFPSKPVDSFDWYNKVFLPINEKYKAINSKKIKRYGFGSLWLYESSYDKLKADEKKFNELFQNFYTQNKINDQIEKISNRTNFEILNQKNLISKEDVTILQKGLKNTTIDISNLHYLSYNVINNREGLFLGLYSEKVTNKHCDTLYINKRIENLKSTEKQLIAIEEQLISLSYRFEDKNNENLSVYSNMIFVENFDSISKALNRILAQVKSLKTAIDNNTKTITTVLNNIETSFDKNKNIRYRTWIFGNNKSKDLQTLGGNLITPNLGVIATSPNFNPVNPYILPFVGVSIHLRETNKNIPLNELSNRYARFANKISFELGLTVSKLNDPSDTYSDLMNKMSLMTGVNYYPVRAFSISTGALWINKANPNPLVSQKTITPSFYFGLAFDLNFLNSASGLTKKIGF